MGKKQLIKNSVIGIIQLVLTAILTLISVPIFIHKLGFSLYGVFAVVSVIGNLNILTNFGLNGALLVYVAKQGKCKESDYDITVTQIVMVTVMILLCVMTIFFRSFIIRNLFSIPQQYECDAEKLLIFLVFANTLLMTGQTFTSIIDAQQKIYITNICQFLYSLIYWGGMIIVVSLGKGLAIVGFVAFIASLVWFIIVYINYKHIWGKLIITGLKHEFKRIAIKQFSYGFKIYLSGLAGFLFEPLSKILLSNFVGLQVVALFEIGMKVRGQINSVIVKALYPIYPYIANTPSSKDLHNKIFDFSKKIQLVVIPISVVVVFVMHILLKLWLGNENLEQTSIFVITMTVSVLLLSPPVLLIYQYLAAKNLADKNIWVQMSSVIINVLVFFSILKVFGKYSILISNTLGYLASFLLCNYYQYKYWGVNFKIEIFYYLKLIIYSIILIVICVVFRYFIHSGIWDLIIYPPIILISFIIFLRNFKLFNYNDLELYFGTMPIFKKRLASILIKRK